MAATILCVDDDQNFCRIIQKALNGAGYRVIIAHDGLEASELASEEAPEFAILDVMLPRRDGFEVLAGIRQLGAPVCDIPVLLLSDGSVTNQYRQRARKLGATAILMRVINQRPVNSSRTGP